MSNSFKSPSETITQLESARKLALGDAAYYPQIVPGVLPIIGATAQLELRRWGADFLAETFAAPGLVSEEKQRLSLIILKTLKDFLEIPREDAAVITSVVQVATSIYPFVFRYTIYNPNDETTWKTMSAIKSNILRRMDTSPAGVKVCCVKFIQRVVQTQTPGVILDPRRPEQNETSLALVPRDHPRIPPTLLEPEAMGLLDRLLSVFQETTSDALLVTATLNSVGILVRTRASTSSRILNVILNFNPFRGFSPPLTSRAKVEAKSMEKTVRAFLINLNKRNPNHPLFARVQGHLERLQQMRTDLFDEGSRKRPAPPVEPTDGLDQAKRQRLEAEISTTPPSANPYPFPTPQGPLSIAQLFTLTRDEGPKNFDVQSIPVDLLNRIIVPILITIDQVKLSNAVNAVRNRYLQLNQPQPVSLVDAARTAIGKPGSVENEPLSEDAEQFLNRLDRIEDVPTVREPEITLGPFEIPQPPPLSPDDVNEYSRGTITRIFGFVNTLEDPITKSSNLGFSRIAASNSDRDSWVTVVSRLATRAVAGLEDDVFDGKVKQEGVVRRSDFSMSDTIRDALYLYVLDDFRRRIAIAISWLNEEWYIDKVRAPADEATPHYDKWVLKILDGIVPYLDAKDKVLIRFLSEIPKVNPDLLERVKRLARDPERVSLAVNAIHYLVLFRPPAREMCIDALEDLWRNYDDAKKATSKLLTKWRPHVLLVAAEPIKADSPIPSRPVSAV